VRDVDDEGRITGIGLSVDPPARPAEVPVFLSIGEALSWLWNFLMELRRRKKKTVEAEEAAGEPVQE